MTPEQFQKVEQLYCRALDHPPQEWDDFLAEHCSEDEGLKQTVKSLLLARDKAGDFLCAPAINMATPLPVTMTETLSPVPDDLPYNIGNYVLLRRAGSGGMGEVYEAQQIEPIRRTVALKLVKWGMDTREVLARFESERQALALMSHSNIAQIFDAGATDRGRPYFVMEYVSGTPITQYSDAEALTIGQRLELFLRVCDGVQHAHQKGVIHRDIKPSNVLISIQDGNPVPKIIDFGLAKAMDARFAQQTQFTQFGAVVGTPAYMSPEQLRSEDLDTRTDVYSLGVLLYELLTGALPFELPQTSRIEW